MEQVVAFLIEHGYALIFALVLVDQLGVPLPAAALLLAAGALARSGHFNLVAAVLLAIAASMIGHLIMYQAGKRAGSKVLRLICGVSLEPDSCIRQAENLFVRHGPKSLIVASFVPGLGTIVRPLAGMAGLSLLRFAALDLIGNILWATSFAALGFAFSEQLARAGALALEAGVWSTLALLLALTAYLVPKLLRRRKLLRQLRIARISPHELKQKLDAGEPVAVVDLRNAIEFQSDPAMIPGAIRISAEELEQGHAQIPRGQDVILYCS